METKVTKRGQTVVPAEIRRRYGIGEGDRLLWLDDGTVIKVVPLAGDALRALRGCGRGEGLVDKLLQSRREDRLREG